MNILSGTARDASTPAHWRERTEFSGLDAIAGWFLDAGSEYSYTTTYLDQTVTAAEQRWAARGA